MTNYSDPFKDNFIVDETDLLIQAFKFFERYL